MFMFPCIFDPMQHELVRSDLLDWCKGQVAPAERGRFFLYRHRWHHTFVVARWAGDKFGIFTDFLHIGHSLGYFDRTMAAEFRQRLYAPISPNDISNAMTDAKAETRVKNDDSNENIKNFRRKVSGRRDVWG